MVYFDGRILGVSGNRWKTNIVGGNIVIFENNEWHNITTVEIQNAFGITNCKDFMDIAVNKNDKTHYFVGSNNTGLYEFRNDSPFWRYHTNNSNLGHNSVYSVLFDNENRLWFANMAQYGLRFVQPIVENDLPIVGVIETMPYDEIKSSAGSCGVLLADMYNPNLKFLTRISSSYIFAFDDKGTPNDLSDDTYLRRNTFIDQNGDIFQNNYYFCATQDKKGAIWVGTRNGPFILPNPHNFFNDKYTVQRPKIPRNDGSGLADWLLENDEIRVIAVDGDNRKWIGTKGAGVYLINEDGTEEIAHFTSENSPLLDGEVLSIAINADGEVFFGTENGIISYQSDSTDPVDPNVSKNEDLHIFPNPVRETYHGPIAIKGVWENAVVKITDISGNLVYETISKGGMVTWDGNRKGGQRVSTGVYLVIITTKDGKNHDIRKLLVIN
jgi:hypothetical protein